MSVALMFPGQGSQAPGMGRALADAFPEAAAVFAQVDDALGEKLSDVIWSGSAEDLTLTRNAQPALMAVSMAALRALEAAMGALPSSMAYLAGHSLGEYSALAAGGSLPVADAARLLRMRGDAMQRAVPAGQGAMAAIIGLEADAVRAVTQAAAQGEVCEIANDNGGGQVVISGHKAAVDRAVEAAKGAGAKRTVILPVSGPFHSSLMRPAAEEMSGALAAAVVALPTVPIVANVTAAPETEPEEIRRNLVAQITGTVRWRESIVWLAEQGVTRFVELGSGKVLAGLVRRIAPGAEVLNAGTPEEINQVAEALG